MTHKNPMSTENVCSFDNLWACEQLKRNSEFDLVFDFDLFSVSLVQILWRHSAINWKSRWSHAPTKSQFDRINRKRTHSRQFIWLNFAQHAISKISLEIYFTLIEFVYSIDFGRIFGGAWVISTQANSLRDTRFKTRENLGFYASKFLRKSNEKLASIRTHSHTISIRNARRGSFNVSTNFKMQTFLSEKTKTKIKEKYGQRVAGEPEKKNEQNHPMK